MKCYTYYYIYSTSKEYIEKKIKNNLKSYFNSLNYNIIEGKKAEKELNELLKSKIIL
jgi:predicted transcriptional regulator